MTKIETVTDPGSSLSKAMDQEPIFVLRAQDELAPQIVRQWASSARLNGVKETKVQEAEECAFQMECWPSRKMPD